MSNIIIPNTTPGTITDNGVTTELPVVQFTLEEARLLREYKKLLQKHHLKEAMYCGNCWDGAKEDGCKAFVTDAEILIACRCRMRSFRGQTF